MKSSKTIINILFTLIILLMLLLEINLLSILGLITWIGLTFKRDFTIRGYQWGSFLFGNYLGLTILLQFLDLFEYPKFQLAKIIQIILTIGIGDYLRRFFNRNNGIDWS